MGDRAAQTTGRAGDDGDASFETGRLHGLSSELGCAVLVGIDATTPRSPTVGTAVRSGLRHLTKGDLAAERREVIGSGEGTSLGRRTGAHGV